MTAPEGKRPWFRIRWQLCLIAIVAILGFLYLRHLSQKPIEILVTGGPAGQSKTLKERMIFIVNLEKSFHRKGWLASLDLKGEDGKTIEVYWEPIDRSFVKQMAMSPDIVSDLRDMGFKRLVLKNAKKEWNLDLKN